MINQFECLSCGGQYGEASADGIPYAHVCGPLPPDKNGVQVERENKRDENPAIAKGGVVAGIRAEGKGVKCLSDKKLKEPRWISAMKARVPKEEDDDAA